MPWTAAAALACLGALPPPAGALPMWELTGTSNRIVLLGSIHFLRRGDFPDSPQFEAIFAEAEVIVMELDLDDMDAAANAATLNAMARDPSGRSLPDLLGARSWRKAVRTAGDLGIDLEAYAAFEPWYAALAASQLRLAQLGFDPALGIEARLASQALQAGKEIRGLETFNAQLQALDGLPARAQARFLLLTLEDAAQAAGSVDEIVSAWKDGETATLGDKLLDGLTEQPEVYRRLVVDRNRNFAEQVAGLANDANDYLVVVGTLHLVGPDSVLVMLANRGRETRQLQ